jgi:hypothetical protein
MSDGSSECKSRSAVLFKVFEVKDKEVEELREVDVARLCGSLTRFSLRNRPLAKISRNDIVFTGNTFDEREL